MAHIKDAESISGPYTNEAKHPDEVGMSYLIGGLMTLGLAVAGLAIGYASAATQWLGTTALAVTGFGLTGTGVWNLMKDSLR